MFPTIPSLLLLLASLGSAGAALAHSYLGERLFVPQIQAQMTWPGGQKAGDFKRQVVRLAWHATSLMWLAFAAIFAAPIFGFDPLKSVYVVAGIAFGALFVMTGPLTAFRHLGWPVFALITACLGALAVMSA